ncbi:MAG: tRNA pseudouridine(13) synthase TruD [Thermofilaceae archaeon]
MPAPTRSQLDRDLGILFYVTEGEGIGGVLRERLEDFKVFEIALGNILCRPGCSNQLSGSGDYVWFLLEKRGVDTLTALRALARAIGVSHKRFSAAGLKDSRAITFQLVCGEGIDPGSIPKRVGEKVLIHDVFRMPFKLAPGMLVGNLFEITVRRLSVPPSEAEERISSLVNEICEAGGAPNYYGYQRFGTIRPITHVIGRMIIHGRFEEAVRELLTRVFPYESQRAREARQYLASTWDIEGALKIFPKRLHHERMILQYLCKHPGDYTGAIRTLPVAVRQLFIEAYQAYLFNKVLSRRIEAGLPLAEPVPGDLVMLGDNEGAILRARTTNLDKLRELVAMGKASVVGNVFGYSSVLAEGEPGLIENEVLREEGLSLDSFKIKAMPEASSKGTYRPFVMNASQLEWKVISYDAPEANFRFVLRRGSYATVLMREFVKPTDPAKQGF